MTNSKQDNRIYTLSEEKPRAAIVREIYWVGVPAALETLLTSAAYIVNNNLAVTYGELTVAAMGIAQKIMSLGNYVYQGFAFGITVVRQAVLYIPLLFLLNRLFRFEGLIWAQPVTELIMMVISVGLLYRSILHAQTLAYPA